MCRSYAIKAGLDDVGTGYSSLSYLKQSPMDNKSGAITGLLLGPSKKLGTRVVAEGVETIKQYDFKKCGGNLIQGF
jgi:EAL domain-containing protein (putative c-di-GMP-specific phosphodiesterase class I)